MYSKKIKQLRQIVKRLTDRVTNQKCLVKALKEKSLIIVKDCNMATVRMLLSNPIKCNLILRILSREMYLQQMMTCFEKQQIVAKFKNSTSKVIEYHLNVRIRFLCGTQR